MVLPLLAVPPCANNLMVPPSDAKRPCSTCVRSHAHAVSHSPAGTAVPSQPDCTFDDGEYLNYPMGHAHRNDS